MTAKKYSYTFIVLISMFSLVVPIYGAEQPIAKPSVLLGVAKDIGGAFKSMGKGLYSASTIAYGLWNKYATPKRVELCVFLLPPVIAIYNYFKDIRPLYQKYHPNSSGLPLKPTDKASFSNIDYNNYPLIHRWNQREFFDSFLSTIRTALGAKKCAFYNTYGEVIAPEYVTWDDVKSTMKQELEQIEEYLEFLKMKYCGYSSYVGPTASYIVHLPTDIVQNYEDLCNDNKADPDASGAWVEEEYKKIDSDIRAKCYWKKQFFWKLNYGNATETWWLLFKKKMRLNKMIKLLEMQSNDFKASTIIVKKANQ